MNWKGIFQWTFLSLVIWLTSSLFAGLIFGMISAELEGNLVVYALGGMLVPFLVFIRYFPFIFALFFSAVIIWTLLSKKFSIFEAERYQILILSLFCLIISVLVWFAFPLDRGLAFPAAFLVYLSIFMPRLISKKLIMGIFVREQKSINVQSTEG